MPVQRLTHLGLCVSDLERSLRFYCDTLGFKQVSRLDVEGEAASTLLQLPAVRLRAVYLERDGACLELLHYASPGALGPAAPRPMNQLGLTHVSLAVTDLDSVAARIERAGGSVLPATRIEIPAARTRAIFTTDPDGTRIELVETPD